MVWFKVLLDSEIEDIFVGNSQAKKSECIKDIVKVESSFLVLDIVDPSFHVQNIQ